MIFTSAGLYIASATDIKTKVARIDAIIDALWIVAADAATVDNITEYSVDNGQTKIQAMYKSAAQVEASIQAFQKQRQFYINQLPGGRVFRLVDGKNFNGNNYGNCR